MSEQLFGSPAGIPLTARSLRILAPQTADASGRIQVRIEGGAAEAQLSWESREATLVPNREAFIAAALLPAMQMQADLQVDAPVSQLFLESLERVQDMYRSWDDSLSRITVRGARPVVRVAGSGARAAVFFSGGLDSFYTLLKHREEITDLILIHGFEIPLDDHTTFERARAVVHGAANRLQKNVIEVRTDVRNYLSTRGLRWGRWAHGPALASVAHLIHPAISRIYISATHTYAALEQWGSHPLLDPLWSTEGLEFVHDGAEATRIDKARALAAQDWPLPLLRVCAKKSDGLNCGRCEKCIRTMINLLLAGALHRATTFEAPLDPHRVARLRFRSDSTRLFAIENLAVLGRSGEHADITRALRTAVNRSEQRRLAREMTRDAWPTGYAMLRGIRDAFLKPRGARWQ